MPARIPAPAPRPAPPVAPAPADLVAIALAKLTSNAEEMARINAQIAKHLMAKRVLVTEVTEHFTEGPMKGRIKSLRTVEQ